MKRLIVLLSACLLVGCGSNIAQIEENENLSMTLKPLPTEIEEKTQFYIHDDLTPVYAMLQTYPSEALIDWDESTGVTTDEWLDFVLMRKEAVRTIELNTEDISSIIIKIDDNEMTYNIENNNQIIEFEEAIMGTTVSIKPLSGGKINEFHITSDVLVDKASYELFQDLEQDLETLCLYEWSTEPKEAFEILNKVFEEFNKSSLDILSKDLDYNRLMYKEGGEGCPYNLSGKVISVKTRAGYVELTVDTIIDKEKVTVYTTQDYELNTMFQETCILVEKNNTLKFITIH